MNMLLKLLEILGNQLQGIDKSMFIKSDIFVENSCLENFFILIDKNWRKQESDIL